MRRGAAAAGSSASGVTCSRSSVAGGEAAGGEDHRRAVRERAAAARRPHSTSPASAATIEPGSKRRPTVRGLPSSRLRHPRAARLEPVEVLVEALEQHALERLVAVRALAPELVPKSRVAPEHAGGEAHRAAGAAPFSRWSTRAPSSRACAAAARPAIPAPATTRSAGHASEKLALCSTYSSLIRPGAQTNTASVLAASTTSATSAPRARTSRSTASAESTSSREVVEQRALALRRAAALERDSSCRRRAGGARPRSKPSSSSACGARVGVLDAQDDVIEVVVEVGLALDQAEHEPLGRGDQRDAVVAALELELVGQLRERRRRGRRRAG